MNYHWSTIIRAIENGFDQAIPISEYTGIPLDSVYARIHELKRLGAVRAYRVPAAKPKKRAHPTEQRKRYELA